MIKLTPNLDQEGKYTRILIGVILLIGSILDFGRIFLFIVGILLLVEGILGWGSVPILIEKFLKKSNTPPSAK